MKRMFAWVLLLAAIPVLVGVGGQHADRPEIRMASPHGYTQTIERLKSAAAAANFSVVFELDITARAKEKGVDVPPTTVLGVCSAKYAKVVMEEDLRVVANLPCRIAVTERAGKVEVWTLDVNQVASVYEGPRMADTAKTVDGVLRGIMASAVAR